MRTLLSVAVLFGVLTLALPAAAQEAEKEKPAPTLKAGDPAPALKATKWLQGTEVKEFADGKVYVVEFWATWCGPCIVMMPHLGDLQREYKDKGVTFIGYSSKDPNNGEEKVTAFVEKRGPKLGYTFAYADDRETNDAWMKAAGRNGIPCSFVVGHDGKIAYIGHPMYLDVVLPKIVAKTWKVDADNEALDGIEKEVSAVFKSFSDPDADAALKTLTEFEEAHPELAHIPYFTGPKLKLLLTAKKTDEAKKFAEDVLARAVKQDDPLPPSTIATTLRTQGQDDKALLALALKAAETGLKIAGDKDARALLSVAEAHFALGDKVQAKDFGAKAVAAAATESPSVQRFIETRVKNLEDGDK